MTTYWMSTKSSRKIFSAPLQYQTKERDALIRETVGVDPAIVAEEAGITPLHVHAYQRRLGLRSLTNPRDYK